MQQSERNRSTGSVAILAEMLDAMQKYLRAGLEALSSQGLQTSSRLAPRLENLTEQVSTAASAMTEWWQEAGSTLVREVRENVVRQVEAIGFATKKDVETLRSRLDRLEAKATSPTRRVGGGAASTRSTSAPRPSARRGKTTPSSSSSQTSPRRGRGAPGPA
ncbi:MAG: hypothetical protein M3N24_06045 [Actinomycetota bacterium]|nr:hypothetical protein [Actinomycetota bacterium]